MIEYTPKRADNLPDALGNLYEILSLLRSPEGCPYDRKQTEKSTLQNLIDESYEYLDGVVKRDTALCREEIGDVLINALMILRIHEEKHDFSPQEAVNEAVEKLYRRHDHVFGKVRAESEEEALEAFNRAKREKEGRNADAKSIFEHIPSSLPPLEMNYEIQKKLARFGFDWPSIDGVVSKVHEELSEVEEALGEDDRDHLEEELGDLLTTIINLCRYVRIRPNVAIERTNEKMRRRFSGVFALANERGIPLDMENVDKLNELWDEIKRGER